MVAWHQDFSYWTRTKPIAHLTCWCGLDDSTKENGCLQYIPGSHNWGLLPKPVIAGELQGIRDFLTEEQKKQFEHPQLAEVKAGEAIFHHSLTLHGSGAVSYTHLTMPTSDLVEISVVAVSLKKKQLVTDVGTV